MRRLWLIFSQAATVALACLFVVATLKPQWLTQGGQPLAAVMSQVVSLRTAAPAAPGEAGSRSAGALGSLADAASLAAPSVVSVTASRARVRTPHADVPGMGPNFEGGDSSQIGIGSAVIVSPAFEGQRMIARHKRVYDALGQRIQNDEVHALSMKTLTPAEWQNK